MKQKYWCSMQEKARIFTRSWCSIHKKWSILCLRIPVLQSKQVIIIRSTRPPDQAQSKYDQPTLYRRPPRCTPLHIRPVESRIIHDHFSAGWKNYPDHHDLSERARLTPAVFQTNIRSPQSRPTHCRPVHFFQSGKKRGLIGSLVWTRLYYDKI